MNKIILVLIAMAIGLSAQALSWKDFFYPTYQPGIPGQSIKPPFYSTVQPYGQIDTTQGYYYQNPYQTQCQVPYGSPDWYRRPYGYSSPYVIVNPATSTTDNTNGSSQVVRNLGQSVIYSMMRGY